MFVDVRDPEEFANSHILGSLNIFPSAIRSKTFLRGKKVVLVDTGYADSRMEALRDGLMKSGFPEVFILDGGLNAWRQVVGPLEGDALVQRRLNRITAQQFFPVREYMDWAMIDVSGWDSAAGGVATGLGGPADGYATGMCGFLAAQLREKAPEARRILILSEEGAGYEAVEEAVMALGWINVFYLEGGKRAYEMYLESQQAMWNRKPGKQGAAMSCGGRRP